MDLDLIMELFSKNGVGAILLDEEDLVVDFNEIARLMLVSTGVLPGTPLPELLSPLKEPNPEWPGICVGFRRYIVPISIDQGGGIPEGLSLITFKDSSEDYEHRMMKDALQHINEAVLCFDAEDRLMYLNNAALDLDSLVEEDVLGKHVTEVWKMADDRDCEIPQVRESGKPHLNHRQFYTTKYGKEVSTLSSTHPLLAGETAVGAYNILENWSTTSTMQKQIIDLQEKLLQHPTRDGKKEKSSLTASYHFEEITYNCPAMKRTIEYCRRAAQTDASVLIYGETGTGKELFAQSIHNASQRAEQPFIAVNCAALPGNLLDSLLFGSVKGAFTGAENRSGLFEQANGGTLLLDELNSMDFTLQAKLLRVLQERRLRRVGEDKEIPVNVRVISNINIDPVTAVREKVLREDLYYRLGEINIRIPPLRKRGNDIFLLARSFIDEYNKRLQMSVSDLSPNSKTVFLTYRWPGNVRELQHAIMHAMSIMPPGATLIGREYLPTHIVEQEGSPAQVATAPDLTPAGFIPADFLPEANSSVSAFRTSNVLPAPAKSDPGADTNIRADSSKNLPEPDSTDASMSAAAATLPNTEEGLVRYALEQHGGNIAAAARDLSLSRQNLQYRIRKYGIDITKIKLQERMRKLRLS